MKRHFLTFALIGLLSNCLFTHGIIYQDEELESIVIDDSLKSFPEDTEPESTTIITEGVCTTSSGFSGTCVPLNECYPYLKDLTDLEAEDNELPGFYLLNLINSTTEYCSEGEGLVCCPSSNFVFATRKPKPTGKPTQRPTNKPATNSTSANAPGKNSCGNRKIKGQLEPHCVGCNEARKHQFPWAVALLNNGRQFCGGSLISSTYILTAAHCVQSLRSTASVSVNLGDHDLLSSSDARHESRGVSAIKYHRGFSMSHLQNDVALIELASPVQFSNSIQPVCLNSNPVSYPGTVTLAGWGKTSNSGGPSRVLRFTPMPLITQSECRRIYQGTNAPQMTSGMICAGQRPPNAVKDACNGDSGGPLTDGGGTKESGVKQVGIVSWGIGCGEKPGVYTAVNEYLAWIQKNSK